MFIDDADISLTGEDYNWTEASDIGELVIPGFGTRIIGEEAGAGNERATLVGPSGTAANTRARWLPALNIMDTDNTNAIVTLSMPWIILPHWALNGVTPAGTNATEATHTHGPGTLVDAASAAGSSHTHAFTGTAVAATALVEVADTTNLATLTGVRFVAVGR